MEDWSKIIGSTPEVLPKPILINPITCVNCNEIISKIETWNKCDNCGFYNATLK